MVVVDGIMNDGLRMMHPLTTNSVPRSDGIQAPGAKNKTKFKKTKRKMGPKSKTGGGRTQTRSDSSQPSRGNLFDFFSIKERLEEKRIPMGEASKPT